MEKFDFLKERAKEFWERGLEDFEKRRFNLSAFDFEQAMQLFIKYLISLKVGDWPKTHYFYELIKELANVYDCEEILKYYYENEIFFSDLEDSYFMSRYFDKKFSENLVKSIIENCKKFLNLIKEKTRIELLNE